jgi:hypothetical protein
MGIVQAEWLLNVIATDDFVHCIKAEQEVKLTGPGTVVECFFYDVVVSDNSGGYLELKDAELLWLVDEGSV